MEVIKHLAQLSSSSPEVALQLPPSTPHAICALVRHCLAIEPQSRPTFPQLVETTLPGVSGFLSHCYPSSSMVHLHLV
eukprot:m.338727 g.338727  ORF g.338727 m.338727 type:complete len:78 (-) comp16086_c1_seq5:686-919(-)